LSRFSYGDTWDEWRRIEAFTVRDLYSFAEKSGSKNDLWTNDLVYWFLRQFDDLRIRWAGVLPKHTLNLLSSAAQFQLDIHVHSRGLSTKDTIIPLALHCLVAVTDAVGWAQANYEPWYPDYGDYDPFVYGHKPTRHYHTTREEDDDSFAASSAPPDNEGWELDADLGSAIHYVAKLSYRLLDEQRGSQDWTAVFYVLVILVLIDQTMEYPTRHHPETLAPVRNALNEVLRSLAHYYYVVSYGGQPLRGHLDNDTFVKMDTPGYRHFGNLNRLGRQTSKNHALE
jgi:hypothetical protein